MEGYIRLIAALLTVPSYLSIDSYHVGTYPV